MTDEAAGSGRRGPIDALRRLLEDERFRFLLVGGFNTVVGYGIFVALELTLGRQTSYLISLYIAYVVGTTVAFVTHRRFTFRISGRHKIVLDYFRFAGVNLVSLAFNTIALPLLVEVAHLPPIAAQAIIVVATTVISYAGHKLFSFRRKAVAQGQNSHGESAGRD